MKKKKQVNMAYPGGYGRERGVEEDYPSYQQPPYHTMQPAQQPYPAYPIGEPVYPSQGPQYYGASFAPQQNPAYGATYPPQTVVHQQHSTQTSTSAHHPPRKPQQQQQQQGHIYGQNYDVEAGRFGNPEILTTFQTKVEQQLRLGFIRKVYSVLSVQLLLSLGFCAYLTMDDAANAFVLSNPGLAITAMVFTFILLLLLMCYRHKYPMNLALLFVWTLSEAYTIGIITASYARAGEGELVLQALAITASLFVALTIFTLQSRIDFSRLGGVLFVALWVLLIWGVISAIFGFKPGFVYSLLGAIIFSLYVVFDTWLLSEKLGYDDWILGAISLYLDIINLFLFILQLLTTRRERE